MNNERYRIYNKRTKNYITKHTGNDSMWSTLQGVSNFIIKLINKDYIIKDFIEDYKSGDIEIHTFILIQLDTKTINANPKIK